MKRTLKQTLRRCGFALRRVRPFAVSGIELADDLAALLPRARPCCIDGGSNDGATITLLHLCLRQPVIHAFEPHQAKPAEVFAFLQRHDVHLVDLYEKCRRDALPGWCNALFAHSSCAR